MIFETDNSVDHPIISVIMAVFNSEIFLSQSIESILRQTYSNFEFIIVDDASTDKSFEIIHTYADKDKRIRVLKNQKNLGLGASLNRAIQVATGEYLARMDADDVSLDGRFQKQLSFMIEHPEIKILGGSLEFFDENNSVAGKLSCPMSAPIIRWNMLLGNGQIVGHPGVFMRKEFIEKIGRYSDSRAAQDFELWSRTFEIEPFPIANLSDTILYYRQHPKTNTNQLNSLQEQVAISTRKKNISKLLDREISEEVVRSFRHTRFDYSNMRQNILTWLEVFDCFQNRFSINKTDKFLIQQEILCRISKYLYINPITSEKKGRLGIADLRRLLPNKIFQALLVTKFGLNGTW